MLTYQDPLDKMQHKLTSKTFRDHSTYRCGLEYKNGKFALVLDKGGFFLSKGAKALGPNCVKCTLLVMVLSR